MKRKNESHEIGMLAIRKGSEVKWARENNWGEKQRCYETINIDKWD